MRVGSPKICSEAPSSHAEPSHRRLTFVDGQFGAVRLWRHAPISPVLSSKRKTGPQPLLTMPLVIAIFRASLTELLKTALMIRFTYASIPKFTKYLRSRVQLTSFNWTRCCSERGPAASPERTRPKDLRTHCLGKRCALPALS